MSDAEAVPGPDASDASTADPSTLLHRLAIELVAMSQNGLTYATDRYDISRYHRLREMSAEVLAMIGGEDTGTFHRALLAEAGHATPKVDVRAALFADDTVLLVREARDGRWTLPGGWADALDAPTMAASREFAEEAGLRVRMSKLAAVHDGTRRNAHRAGAGGTPWHVYKLMFVAERLDDAAPQAGLDGETTDVAFFGLDELPPLSTGRTTVEQLQLLHRHWIDPSLPTEVD
jgi:ADP-ribose pyrophosphatase YjhB (NUDIX family)